jgi:hypothetical protein
MRRHSVTPRTWPSPAAHGALPVTLRLSRPEFRHGDVSRPRRMSVGRGIVVIGAFVDPTRASVNPEDQASKRRSRTLVDDRVPHLKAPFGEKDPRTRRSRATLREYRPFAFQCLHSGIGTLKQAHRPEWKHWKTNGVKPSFPAQCIAVKPRLCFAR